MLLIVFAFSYLYEVFIEKRISEKVKKSFIRITIFTSIILISLILIYSLNLFNSQYIFNGYHIVQKFTKGFINDQRFELYFGSFPLMPRYLFGGQHISAILGEQVHDLWIDIYDYAGVITWFIMIIFSLFYAKSIIDVYKQKTINYNLRLLMIGVYICIVLQMFVEPIMTGASLFLIVSIIIGALLERLTIHEK